jgi:tail collar domain
LAERPQVSETEQKMMLSRRRLLLGVSSAAAAAVIKANIPAVPIEPGAYIYEQPSWVPEGWLYPDGRPLLRSEYSRLFSAIGTVYGSDGPLSFRLPDFRAQAETKNVGWVMAGEDTNHAPGSILLMLKNGAKREVG